MVLFFFFIYRQARGAQDSIFSFGRSPARIFVRNGKQPKITFKDVAGVDEAKKELTEVVDFLKNPDKYKKLGARTPKGVLLVGPSGTGKTLLAKAVAGEAGVPFFSMAGSEFMEMLVGVGASRVRDLFNTAKKAAPSIIFIDEIDAIGRQRATGVFSGGHDEREQTLNQILVEMDGFTTNDNVMVIAATNRGDLLDSALLRPGRFDRRVVLDLPDMEGREAILKIHAQGKVFVPEIKWGTVAKQTVGFSGADLENMLNEAAIFAAGANKVAIEEKDIREASVKVKLGPERKRLQSIEDRKMTAYHEAGHALVSFYSPQTDPVRRVSIVARGMSLGHTMISPAKDRSHETKTRLEEQISVMMGGRAAEQMIFKEMTTGAANDIANATRLARAMVVNFGMSQLGPIYLAGQSEEGDLGKLLWYEPANLSPDTQAKIDTQIKEITTAAYRRAVKILKTHRTQMDILAKALLEKETLEEEEFEKIMEEVPSQLG
jgi:cell division protease FtsH